MTKNYFLLFIFTISSFISFGQNDFIFVIESNVENKLTTATFRYSDSINTTFKVDSTVYDWSDSVIVIQDKSYSFRAKDFVHLSDSFREKYRPVFEHIPKNDQNSLSVAFSQFISGKFSPRNRVMVNVYFSKNATVDRIAFVGTEFRREDLLHYRYVMDFIFSTNVNWLYKNGKPQSIGSVRRFFF